MLQLYTYIIDLFLFSDVDSNSDDTYQPPTFDSEDDYIFEEIEEGYQTSGGGYVAPVIDSEDDHIFEEIEEVPHDQTRGGGYVAPVIDSEDDHIFDEIEEDLLDDAIPSSISSEAAYCPRCVRLSKHCNCVECKRCDQFYIENMEHACPNHATYCGICNHKITSATNLCYHCDLEKIIEICETVTPTKQLLSPQCLRCLRKLENNTACHCVQCEKCKLYLPLDQPHNCSKLMLICKECNHGIISYSKKCLYCESHSKN